MGCFQDDAAQETFLADDMIVSKGGYNAKELNEEDNAVKNERKNPSIGSRTRCWRRRGKRKAVPDMGSEGRRSKAERGPGLQRAGVDDGKLAPSKKLSWPWGTA